MITASDLHVSIDDKKILKGVNLKINPDEVTVMMGPNGSGKSTFAQALMGSPVCEVTKGKLRMGRKSLLKLDSSERSKLGIFLSFQYPSELTGVSVSNFLRFIYNKKNNTNLSPVKFRKILKEKMEILDMDESFLSRYLNEGFSGGEKKRMEMLQMLVLEPKYAILDETDSGLDIDALRVVARAVNHLKQETKMGVLVITHYTRVLDYIKPDKVYVMKNGKIVKSGGAKLANMLEEQGYAPFGE